MVKVKICGITNREDLLVALEAGADFVGFVREPTSPRFVSWATLVESTEVVRGFPGVCSVAVYGLIPEGEAMPPTDLIQALSYPSPPEGGRGVARRAGVRGLGEAEVGPEGTGDTSPRRSEAESREGVDRGQNPEGVLRGLAAPLPGSAGLPPTGEESAPVGATPSSPSCLDPFSPPPAPSPHGGEGVLTPHPLPPPPLEGARGIADHWQAIRLGHDPLPEPLPEFLVLDAYSPTQAGGTGQTINWEQAREIARQTKVILAGGLTPGNVSEAIEKVQPWAVDVSSGVEISPGRKDHDKMRAFIRAAKSH